MNNMKRILSAFLAVLLLGATPVLQMGGTAADERVLWATVSDGNTHLMPGEYEKTLKKYDTGKLTEVLTYSDWAWKNDYVSSRIDLLLLDKDIPAAELVTGDLVSASGAVIGKENITATYLKTASADNESYPSDDYYFDVITLKSVKDLAAGQIHEAWVQIYVPEDAEAGIYNGSVCLKSENKTLVEISYEIEVIDMTLTDPDQWQTRVDLWTYPYASNRYYSGKSTEEYFAFTTPGHQDTNPYSLYNIRLNKEYEAGLESELELYAKAGGDVITATLVEDPWNSRYPCPCPSMVKWTKKADGTFSYDYTDFDYWVELNMKHGIDEQINLFFHAGVGWGFVYYDEATGKVTNSGSGQPGSEAWKKMGLDFLEDLIAHLEEKGWFDIACIYMDERGLEVTKAMIELASQAKNSEGKPIKVGGAVNAGEVSSVFDQMDDIAIWENALPDNIVELSEERRKNGQITTVYTCGAGKMSMPNQPAEAAYAIYDSLKYNTDGILRWALNKYDADPHADGPHYIYAGDCYLIYPAERDSGDMQALSTPRFEKMCEGLRDVEKLRILRANYPEFSDSLDNLVASLGKNEMTTEVARMRTRILSMSRAALALDEEQYTDIAEGAWYEEAVRFSLANGFMNGVSASRFDPDGSMTRAMFVTVLARLDGAEIDNNATSVFKDVPSGQWYTGAIAWASKSGLLYGVGDGKFAPHDTLTREQTATLLFRYANRKKYDTEPQADLSGYKDYDKIGSYALEAMSWANAMGIVRGVSANSLDPRGNCTRAQVAQMFRLFCMNVENQ